MSYQMTETSTAIAFISKKSLTENFDLFKVSFGNYRTCISEKLSAGLKNVSGLSISFSNKVKLNE